MHGKVKKVRSNGVVARVRAEASEVISLEIPEWVWTQDMGDTRFEFVKLWKDQPHWKLPFRFGYPDAAKNNHLMITRPTAKAS